MYFDKDGKPVIQSTSSELGSLSIDQMRRLLDRLKAAAPSVQLVMTHDHVEVSCPETDVEHVRAAIAKVQDEFLPPTLSGRTSAEHENLANTPGRVWHRQFVELGIKGPRRVRSEFAVYDPTLRTFQDRCFWLRPEECQTPGLVEWAKQAKPGDTFIWYNPLSKDTQGGSIYICVDLWYEDE